MLFRSLPRAEAEPHRHRHFASILDRTHGRPDRRHRPGPYRRPWQPCRADAGQRHLREPVHAEGAWLSVTRTITLTLYAASTIDRPSVGLGKSVQARVDHCERSFFTTKRNR